MDDTNLLQNNKPLLRKFLDNSYSNEKQKKSIDGYKRVGDLSGNRVQVYQDADGHAVISHRGTQSWQDVGNDVRLGLGLGVNKKRINHAKKIQHQAEKRFGAENVSTVAHSLGGRVIEQVASKKNKEIITYNKASGTGLDMFKKIRKPNQVDIRTRGDVVSAIGLGQTKKKAVTLPMFSVNPLLNHGTRALTKKKK